jgi:hypothetical protein
MNIILKNISKKAPTKREKINFFSPSNYRYLLYKRKIITGNQKSTYDCLLKLKIQ